MRILRIRIVLERLRALFSAKIKIGPRLLSRGLGDSPQRFSQRKPAAYRKGAPFARAGGTDLRLGDFHHLAHFARRGFRLRAPLAPAGKRRRDYAPSHAVHCGQSSRASPRSDSRQQGHRRMRARLPRLQHGGILAERRKARASGLDHLHRAASPLAGVKTISWLNNVWAASEANKEGFDEVVMLNERGEVTECTSANIFAVKEGKILTPPLNSGCLEGVTRGILMEIAPETGVSVVEQALRPEELYSAEEVFISSTNRNLISVDEIAGHKIAVGPVCDRMNDLFNAYIDDYVSRRLAAAVK